MKNTKYLVIVTILFLNFQILFAQDEPDPPPPPHWELSSEDEQEYLKNIDSDLKLKLQRIKEYDEQKYQEYLQELRWRGMELSFMHHGSHDKEMIEREKQIIEYNIMVEELAIQYQNANSSSQAEIKKELQKKV